MSQNNNILWMISSIYTIFCALWTKIYEFFRHQNTAKFLQKSIFHWFFHRLFFPVEKCCISLWKTWGKTVVQCHMFEKNDAVVRWNRRDVVMYFFLFCAGFDLKKCKTKKPLHVILFLFWYVKWYFSETLLHRQAPMEKWFVPRWWWVFTQSVSWMDIW